MIFSNYILYDAKCKFCTASANYFISKKRTTNLTLIPIQEQEARSLLRKHGIKFVDLNTIYFVNEDKVYVRSKAIFTICKHLKSPFYFVNYFSILPTRLTDGVYKWIAKNRYKLM